MEKYKRNRLSVEGSPSVSLTAVKIIASVFPFDYRAADSVSIYCAWVLGHFPECGQQQQQPEADKTVCGLTGAGAGLTEAEMELD